MRHQAQLRSRSEPSEPRTSRPTSVLRRNIRRGFIIAGFTAINAVATLGIVMLLFFALARFDAGVFFEQLSDLSSHYLVAGATRRAQFLGLVWALTLSLFIFICGLRLSALRDRLALEE